MNDTADELHVRAAFEAAVAGEFAPVERIMRGAISRGRRKRRWQVARTAAGVGIAGTIAVVVGSVSLPGGSGQPAGETTTPVGTQVPVTHQFAVPAGDVAQTLARLMPAGRVTDLRTNNFEPAVNAARTLKVPGGNSLHSVDSPAAAPYRGGSLLLDDGRGAAEVDVMIQAPDPDGPTTGTIDLGSSICRGTGVTCRVVMGGVLVTEHADAALPGGIASSRAIYLSSGWAVTVTAYNAIADKGVRPTRALPALTTSQLAVIATNTGWLK